MPANDARLHALENWLSATIPTLKTAGDFGQWSLQPASADASFRRYFRLTPENQATESLIVMDAPPPQEDCRPFIARAAELRAAGLNAPEVMASDVKQGFLLLSDLGNETYLSVLPQQIGVAADGLYRDAIDALVLQQSISASQLPKYDEALLRREMQLFPDWLISRHLNLALDENLWQSVTDMLVESALEQPAVYVHRDYHSRNLMHCRGITNRSDSHYRR